MFFKVRPSSRTFIVRNQEPSGGNASNFKEVLNNNVLETYYRFIYFIKGDVQMTCERESNGFFDEERFSKKAHNSGKKVFEGVCIQSDGKKEKKVDCYAM